VKSLGCRCPTVFIDVRPRNARRPGVHLLSPYVRTASSGCLATGQARGERYRLMPSGALVVRRSSSAASSARASVRPDQRGTSGTVPARAFDDFHQWSGERDKLAARLDPPREARWAPPVAAGAEGPAVKGNRHPRRSHEVVPTTSASPALRPGLRPAPATAERRQDQRTSVLRTRTAHLARCPSGTDSHLAALRKRRA